jgi:hypothetical protein
VAAAVLRRAAALDEPRALEVVEEPDQVGAVDLQRRGQVGLAALAEVAQQRQRDQVPRAEGELRQLGLGLDADAPGEVVQQGAGQREVLVDDGQLGDGRSVPVKTRSSVCYRCFV